MQGGGRDRKVLGSWKEIAAYLGKGVRTVQRWENDLGLPVRRPTGTSKGVVYAWPDELDRWLNIHWARRPAPVKEDGNAAVKASRELRRANVQLVEDLMQIVHKLRAQCEALIPASAQTRRAKRLPKKRQLEIVQTRGHTGPYLELPAGKASMKVLKMARPGLLFELQNALEEARKSGVVEGVRPGVVVEGNCTSKITNLRVSPFKTPVQDKASILIAFEPGAGMEAPTAEAVPSPLSDDERTLKDKQTAQLKQELAATKEYLQSIIKAMEATNEELQSANEEIQSGNEELQSTNEELQTSKEELESANEVLHTVNEEMQHGNEQLNQLNNDLNNLLNSVNLPMVMVGPELNIRRFTPQASKILGLTASDVGRPITRLRLKLVDAGDLEETMLNAIAEVRPSHQRLLDPEGQWCELRVTPYRTSDNRIDGVVLSVLTPEDSKHADAITLVDGSGAARKKAKAKHNAKRAKRR